nr:helix-turn-helix domain-containing protein [Shewanella abyssi]
MVNTDTAQTLNLSNIELLVMSHLMSARGQVVSTESLCCKLIPQVVTAQDIALAITNIRAFLGAESAMMIEVVTNQGYLLHTKARAQMHNSPYEALSIKQFSLFLVLGILLVVFLATHFKTTPNISFTLPEKILLEGKTSKLVPIYSSSEQKLVFEDKFRQIAVEIDACEQVAWQEIYVSTSKMGDILHFVMHNSAKKGKEFRNFKVLRAGSDWAFIDQLWLKEAGFCE